MGDFNFNLDEQIEIFKDNLNQLCVNSGLSISVLNLVFKTYLNENLEKSYMEYRNNVIQGIQSKVAEQQAKAASEAKAEDDEPAPEQYDDCEVAD